MVFLWLWLIFHFIFMIVADFLLPGSRFERPKWNGFGSGSGRLKLTRSIRKNRDLSQSISLRYRARSRALIFFNNEKISTFYDQSFSQMTRTSEAREFARRGLSSSENYQKQRLCILRQHCMLFHISNLDDALETKMEILKTKYMSAALSMLNVAMVNLSILYLCWATQGCTKGPRIT